MFRLGNEPEYSTPVATMASVMNRLSPKLTTHYLEFMLGHMVTPQFLWLGNLPLIKIAEMVNAENPPAWVPLSFIAEVDRLRNDYRNTYS